MKSLLSIIMLFSMSTLVWSQESIIKENWWMTFSGTFNDQPMSISLNRTEKGTIVGSSCDILKNVKVNLIGSQLSNKLKLKASVKDSIIGVFDGMLFSEEDTIFKGAYTSSDDSNSHSFDLKYSSGSYGTPDKRYIEFPGTDQALEDFSAQIITAFQVKDARWLSKHMLYPLAVYHKKGSQMNITGPQEFIENFYRIRTSKLLDKMTSWQTCNLFSNHSGVMLGRGEIWIWRDDSSTDDNPKYRIKNILTY